MKKVFKNADLSELLKELKDNFNSILKEYEASLVRQKQRYSINNLVDEYQLTVTFDLKKVRK